MKRMVLLLLLVAVVVCLPQIVSATDRYSYRDYGRTYTPPVYTHQDYTPQTSSFTSGGATCYHSVPEPMTLLLLGSGMVGLAALRRRFKK